MAANRYTSSDMMKTLIADNPMLLMAMSRFSISLGIGDKTVGEICRRNDVDCSTFLAVCNFISFSEVNPAAVSVESLMQYLKQAHSYFLDYCLPMIRRRLIEAIDCARDEVAMLIVKFYDEYVDSVNQHMQYENETVFAYVDSLLNGKRDKQYSISVFASGHHSIDNSLRELKEIIIQYLPQKDNNMLNGVLFDIINCREDLITHCSVEDRLFVPAVAALEAQIDERGTHPAVATSSTALTEDDTELSDREKEIIALVAKGLSNKDIADSLCISINTVTTHRRNIANKLNIHSPAALAIYAVINGIITLDL